MPHEGELVGSVSVLRRYPVKSMLGEAQAALAVSAGGTGGDRAWAVIDRATGKVASAKRPQLWRRLLSCRAQTLMEDVEAGQRPPPVEIELPDGSVRRAGDPELDGLLSELTGRAVHLAATPHDGAALDRSHPEAVTADDLDREVGSDILTLGAAVPARTFFDYAPLHLITTATLDGLAAALDDGPVELERYRANIVIRTGTTAAFPENDWVGGTLRIGGAVALRVILQTPRCAVPMLAHGALPPRPGALRAAADRNRIAIEGFGDQPCAGIYAEVLSDGVIRVGDPVSLGRA